MIGARVGRQSRVNAPTPEFTKTPAKPFDQKILGGIALVPFRERETLEELRWRLRKSFKAMRGDQSSEAGSCLAYGYDLPEGVVDTVDGLLLNDTRSQGRIIYSTAATVVGPSEVWRGRDGDHAFALHKYTGLLALDDGTMPAGVVYSLLSSSVQHEQRLATMRGDEDSTT